jgi:hypothetical protein
MRLVPPVVLVLVNVQLATRVNDLDPDVALRAVAPAVAVVLNIKQESLITVTPVISAHI